MNSVDCPHFRFPRDAVSEEVKFGSMTAVNTLPSSQETLMTTASNVSVGTRSLSIVHSQERTSADFALSEDWVLT